jgi:CHAD domain-containing protein
MPRKSKEKLNPLSAAALVQSGCAESVAAMKHYHARAVRFQAEPIHQMRIGTRRLRAVLHIFAGIMDAQWASELESELRWLAHLLGGVRDLDVLRARLRESSKTKKNFSKVQNGFRSVDGVLAQRHKNAKTALQEGLQSERYNALVERLHAGQLSAKVSLEANGQVLDILLPRLNRAWKKLSRAAEKLKQTDDAPEYHRVRKMAKRIRYTTELMSADFSPKERERVLRFTGKMKKLQDTLGELQDADVAGKTVELLLQEKSEFAGELQILIDVQKQFEEKARRKFPKSWRAARELGNKKWMTGLSSKASRTIA